MSKRPSARSQGLSDFELRQRKRAEKAKRKYRAEKKRRVLKVKRARIEKREREVLYARERTKLIRPYVAGFESADGYDLRRPKALTRSQKQKIERVYRQLAPLILKPHVRVRAPTKKKLRALIDFQRIEDVPRGMKAVPIITPSPENTKVTVDESGLVRMKRGRYWQEFYLIPKELEHEPRADLIAREMLKTMPKGRYFALTGEHEAYSEGVLHDPDDPASENLALRLVRRWIGHYGADRVGKFFRGFRFIARADDAGREKAFRETERFRARRRLLEKARRLRQRGVEKVSRRRARRAIPRK